MKTKPLYVNLMSFFFLITALGFPVQIGFLYNLGFNDLSLIFNKLTPLNYLCITLLIFASSLTYKLNDKLFYLLPIINFSIVLNNFVVYQYGTNHSFIQTTIASLMFLIPTLLFYSKNIFKVYHFKNFRYWLTAKRIKKNFQVKVEVDDQVLWSTTHDISKSGMFLLTEEKLYKKPINSNINIYIQISKRLEIKLDGSLIRKAKGVGTYPQGVGIKFNTELRDDYLSFITNKTNTSLLIA